MQLNPRLPTAHALYGRSLLALGDQDAAERAFREELDLNINDFEANLQLGYMRKAAQEFDDASTYLERAMTIRPNDLAARKLLASLRLQTGHVEEAARMLEAIVKEAPDLIEAHVQLATAYNRLKRKDDAERERAIIDRLNAEAQAKQQAARVGGSIEGRSDEQLGVPPRARAGDAGLGRSAAQLQPRAGKTAPAAPKPPAAKAPPKPAPVTSARSSIGCWPRRPKRGRRSAGKRRSIYTARSSS